MSAMGDDHKIVKEEGSSSIVVVSPKWTGAMNLVGEEVPVDQYMEQIPQVKELLDAI